MRSLGHEAYDRLRRSLMTGQIAPGARIIETEMARQFGTSQAPIREALARLREDGLVRRLPYKGTYATEIIPRELYHTCRVRAEIESNGLELTVGRLTQTQIAELQALVSRMDALAADTPQEYFQQVQMDMAFHRRLVEWTDIAVYSTNMAFTRIGDRTFFESGPSVAFCPRSVVSGAAASGSVEDCAARRCASRPGGFSSAHHADLEQTG